jgi:hypothetical protein
MIREIWDSYSTSDLNEYEKANDKRRFKSGIQKAVDAKVHFERLACAEGQRVRGSSVVVS